MTLHQEIKEELGNRTIERLPLPDYFATALTPRSSCAPIRRIACATLWLYGTRTFVRD